jgi:signal transduction histidine kinase
VLNLVSNAVKFTPDGGAVRVSCGRIDSQVEIEVRDNGPGIPADKQQDIFEPFVQLGRTLTSTHEGAGLGLAISRDLARAMGGDVTVESTLGAGSTFVLRLPAA